MIPDGERRARVALSFLAKPGDPVLGAALRTRAAAELLALVTGADADGEAVLAGQTEDPVLSRAVQRWRDRLGQIPGTGRLAAWQDSGLRVILPGDPEWRNRGWSLASCCAYMCARGAGDGNLVGVSRHSGR
jgi:DNA processing protein